MNGLRYVIALCLVFFTVMVGIEGAGNEEEKEVNQILKTTNVAEAFCQEGIQLSLSAEHSPADFIINEKLPVIYDFPGNGEKLFIYEFSSIDKEHETINKITKEKILENISGFAELQKGCLISTLQAKNILLLYVVKYDVQAASEMKDIASLYRFVGNITPHMEILKGIIFSNLNGGETVRYQGSGPSWEGKVVVNYYQYDWKDKKGNNHCESWNNEEFYLKYLGNDVNSLDEIMCSYEGPSGGGQGIFLYASQYFDREGYLCLESPGGNGVLNLDLNYTMTIRWEHGADIFVLEKTG